MMPIGPLMIEHRLIERVIALLKQALREAVSSLEGGPGSGEKTAPGA